MPCRCTGPSAVEKVALLQRLSVPVLLLPLLRSTLLKLLTLLALLQAFLLLETSMTPNHSLRQHRVEAACCCSSAPAPQWNRGRATWVVLWKGPGGGVTAQQSSSRGVCGIWMGAGRFCLASASRRASAPFWMHPATAMLINCNCRLLAAACTGASHKVEQTRASSMGAIGARGTQTEF